MLIAQISDFHVVARGKLAFGQIDTNDALAAVIARLNSLRPSPDLVVMTGDLVNDGLPEQYEMLRDLLRPLTLPWCAIPGNHDDRDGLRALCADQPWMPADGPFLHFAIDHLPVRIIGLDTQVPGAPQGELCAERTRWLADRLAEAPERPTVIAMHHPPFETGIGFMDALRCFGTEGLADLVRRHPAIERILCGHLHRPTTARWHGTLAGSAPGTGFQMALDLHPGAGPAWTREPPAILLHIRQGDIGFVSHVLPVGDHPAHPIG
jgi:Icc protein